MDWKENLQKLRRFIDGEDEVDVSGEIKTAHDNKSVAEKFFFELKIKIEELLKDEIIRIETTNKAYVPRRFVIFLDQNGFDELSANKRQFIEQGLGAILLEAAKEMSGDLQLTTKKIAVEIKSNGALDENETEIKAFSDDKSKTIEFVQEISKEEISPKVFNDTIDELATIDDFDTFAGFLYRLEVWKNGELQNKVPVLKRLVTIGRSDSSKEPDIKLKTDERKISGTHAEINFVSEDEIQVTSMHKNPTFVSGKLIRKGQTEKLGADGEIQIYDFTLKLNIAE